MTLRIVTLGIVVGVTAWLVVSLQVIEDQLDDILDLLEARA